MSRELIIVAEILRPHGRRGEVVLRPHTDHLETITGSRHLYLGQDADTPTEVQKVRLHKGAPLLKLAGVDSIDQALALKGRMLCLPPEDLFPLSEGEYFLHDLVGQDLADHAGRILGRVQWIMETGGPPVLVATAPDGRELMVPFAPGTIADVDLGGGVIRMTELPGLPVEPEKDAEGGG